MIYSGKQLKTMQQPGAAKMDLPEMMIWGNLVKAQRADDPEKASPLVPKSWQLIKMKQDGVEEIIAERVLSYDLGENGNLFIIQMALRFIRSIAEGVKSELPRIK
jgi:hypothetical protein